METAMYTSPSIWTCKTENHFFRIPMQKARGEEAICYVLRGLGFWVLGSCSCQLFKFLKFVA